MAVLNLTDGVARWKQLEYIDMKEVFCNWLFIYVA